MIKAVGIDFGYRKGQPIIRDWSAELRSGESVAIVGASGSGKSTLLYLFGALVRPWAGSLSVAGIPIEAASDRRRSDVRARDIGFVFQDSLLDGRRSVLDNVIEGAVYRGERRASAVQGAYALLDRVGVQVEPRRPAVNLSGGQAQRVALCRALLHDPPIVLADEPTGNLDRDNSRVVEDLLLERARGGNLVVIVTHDETLASRCDRTLRL
jgi:putative ABC transport system ATP-binding protein/lipoprotein-releasing system ATP-binding protein